MQFGISLLNKVAINLINNLIQKNQTEILGNVDSIYRIQYEQIV